MDPQILVSTGSQIMPAKVMIINLYHMDQMLYLCIADGRDEEQRRYGGERVQDRSNYKRSPRVSMEATRTRHNGLKKKEQRIYKVVLD